MEGCSVLWVNMSTTSSTIAVSFVTGCERSCMTRLASFEVLFSPTLAVYMLKSMNGRATKAANSICHKNYVDML